MRAENSNEGLSYRP